jgi:hypothetical protein
MSAIMIGKAVMPLGHNPEDSPQHFSAHAMGSPSDACALTPCIASPALHFSTVFSSGLI